MREISHKKLKTKARKMRTQKEIKDRVSIFQTKAWKEKREEIKNKINKEIKNKINKEIKNKINK